MALPRRFLPSMQLLRAFEACARLSNFTAAAKELHLTQSAVSRQVRALEEQLGGELFVRDKQTTKLTIAGEAYATEVREVLQRLASATLGFRASPQGGALRLATFPTFGARWLAPRLPDFLSTHPGIAVHLVTRLDPLDHGLDAVDAAIHYGTADWPGVELDFLMPETVVPACSEGFRQRHDIRSIEDLVHVPLLHLVSRPDAWERWFRAHDVAHGEVHGMLCDQFAMITQAAVAGLGVALLPAFLFESELQRGDLVEVVHAPLTNAEGYYLASPSGRVDYPPLQMFRQWLTRQAMT